MAAACAFHTALWYCVLRIVDVAKDGGSLAEGIRWAISETAGKKPLLNNNQPTTDHPIRAIVGASTSDAARLAARPANADVVEEEDEDVTAEREGIAEYMGSGEQGEDDSRVVAVEEIRKVFVSKVAPRKTKKKKVMAGKKAEGGGGLKAICSKQEKGISHSVVNSQCGQYSRGLLSLYQIQNHLPPLPPPSQPLRRRLPCATCRSASPAGRRSACWATTGPARRPP